jgi:superfamily II DNA or RNA helicase
MARSTAKVVITQDATHGYITDEEGGVPWDDVSEECSFFDSTLSKKLYPDVKVRADLGEQPPPVRLFDRSSKKFPIGLLDRVVRTLEEQGVEIVHGAGCDEPSSGFNFKWSGPTPRDYQSRIVQEVIGGRRFGIIACPTGGGKTLIGARLIQQMGLRTLWIVHSADLVRQTSDFLKRYLGLRAGTVGAGRFKLGTVTVATAQALQRGKWAELEARDWLPDLLIEDEVHHAGAWGTYQTLLQIPATYRYGLTATPERVGADSLVLEAAYGGPIASVSLDRLQEKGYVAPVTIRAVAVKPKEGVWEAVLDTWEKIYQEGIVKFSPRNEAVRSTVADLRKEGRQVLVDIDEVGHLDHLRIPESVSVTGSISAARREQIYNDFRNGDTKTLVGTVLREGIDLPNVGAVVLAGGKKSKIQVLQEIGRGFRPSEGKENCVVVDFVDNQHSILFEHSQSRFKTLRDSGFSVPDGVIRSEKSDVDIDNDEIEKIRKKQRKLRRTARRTRKHKGIETDGFEDDV